jgi:pantoate--beta-alanine ligase
MKFAPTLYAALNEGKRKWEEGRSKGECVNAAMDLIASRIRAFEEGNHGHISTKVDYILINDPDTLEELGNELTQHTAKSGVLVLSGAIWVGKTRLIDNVLLGDENIILGRGQ